MPDMLLAELQSTLDRSIPMCAQMGIKVQSYSEAGLILAAPLAVNLNHQQTAFAGSLNALCTVAGWGMVFLLTRQNKVVGDIVIRRSKIKYLRPVDSPEIVARCSPVGEQEQAYFLEMFQDKGQAKLDLHVEVANGYEQAVSFNGSYVLLGRGQAAGWTADRDEAAIG